MENLALSPEAAFEQITNTAISGASQSDFEKTEDNLVDVAREFELSHDEIEKLKQIGMGDLASKIISLENAVKANDWAAENL